MALIPLTARFIGLNRLASDEAIFGRVVIWNLKPIYHTLSMVTVGQSPWDDINILELGLGHLISKF